MILLPSAPTVGQRVDAGTKVYQWDGEKWMNVTPTAPANDFVMIGTLASRPATVPHGTFYIVAGDSNMAINGDTYVYSELAGWLNMSGQSQAQLDTEFLRVTGGTMTGHLALAEDPIAPLSAVPRRWLRAQPKPTVNSAVYGGTIVEDVGFRSHIFRSGTDVLTVIGSKPGVEVIVVGGGGGGGSFAGGGGGGGGIIRLYNQTLVGNYYVSVGVGGGGAPASSNSIGESGASTSFGTLIAKGGGGGGSGAPGSSSTGLSPGGGGGGAGRGGVGGTSDPSMATPGGSAVGQNAGAGGGGCNIWAGTSANGGNAVGGAGGSGGDGLLVYGFAIGFGGGGGAIQDLAGATAGVPQGAGFSVGAASGGLTGAGQTPTSFASGGGGGSVFNNSTAGRPGGNGSGGIVIVRYAV